MEWLVNEDRAMNTQLPKQSTQEASCFRRVGFLVYPDCQILDVCGPFEAFHFAHHWLRQLGKTAEPGYRSIIMATAPGRIRTMSGMEIVATHGYDEISDGLDTLIVAGGLGVEQACTDEALVEWVRSMAPRARRVASICSGAFMLAAAGLLHQRRATTHWLFSNLLAKAYPSIEVDASMLFVRDGNIYTSGGITAGIDLALALVEEDVGQEVMLAVARTMVVFPRRPGRTVPVQRIYFSIGENRSAGHQPTSNMDDGPSGSRFERAGLGGPHGHEPTQFLATFS